MPERFESKLETSERLEKKSLIVGMVGCMASGKTTLSKELGRRWGVEPIEEKYPDNPFLVPFYENLNPSGYNEFSFKSEMFFLTEKIKQLKSGGTLIDPALSMDLLYAKTHFEMGWMNAHEFSMYEDTLESLSLENGINYPNVHIGVRADLKDLEKRIRARNRKYEMFILENCPVYLARLSENVEEWMGEKDGKTYKLMLDTSSCSSFSDVETLALRAEIHIAAKFAGIMKLPNFPVNNTLGGVDDTFPGMSSESARLRR